MARFLITILGSSKQNCDWHIFTVSILFVITDFRTTFRLNYVIGFLFSVLSYAKGR